jgi:2-oxoglutarate dehydrogenase complex dehydrogenase (E1) component-like enzyme
MDFHEEEANKRLEDWQNRLSKVKKYMKGMKEREMCWKSQAKRARRNAERRSLRA